MNRLVKFKKLAIVVVLVLGGVTATFAVSGGIVPSTNESELHTSISLPQAATCQNLKGFTVLLGQDPAASPVQIVASGIKWAGNATVTEFVPSQPISPFSRFYFLETPLSHKVSWAMAIAFFKSEELASDAAAQFSRWYGDSLKRDVRSHGTMYSIRDGELYLMIYPVGNALRVYCEHSPTQHITIQEAISDRRRK